MTGALRCAVVGGANVDIGGFSAGPIVPRDSNPGRVVRFVGGVGRNIACTLSLLGAETHLVSPLGLDAFGELIQRDTRRYGVDMGHSLVLEGASSSVYLYIAGPRGDMELAVSDMDICSSLTPERIEPLVPFLNAMDAVVMDANLPQETISYIAGHVTSPLFADAVSAVKAPRLLSALPRLAAVKPNGAEAEALTGVKVRDPASGLVAARSLVAMGAQRAYVTLGALGACCADSETAVHIPSRPSAIVSATGAGDAFTAAAVWAQMRGLGLMDSARSGMAAARATMESIETINGALTGEELIRRAHMEE